jgi:hypothetical protein
MNREEYVLKQTRYFQRKMFATFQNYMMFLKKYAPEGSPESINVNLGFMKMLDFCADIVQEYKPLLKNEVANMDPQEHDELMALYDHVTYTNPGLDEPLEDGHIEKYMNEVKNTYKEEFARVPELVLAFEDLSKPLITLQDDIGCALFNYSYTCKDLKHTPKVLIIQSLVETLSEYTKQFLDVLPE